MSDKPSLTRRAVVQGSVVGGAAAVLTVAVPAPASAVPPATVQSVETALYEANNNTYGTASIGGTYAHCQVVFTAPDSGRVLLLHSGAPRNISSGSSPVAYISPEVRTGTTPGSGTVVLAASDTRSVRSNLTGSETVRAGASFLLSSLTAGASYNVRLLHRVTSSSGQFFHRTLIVAPAT